MDTRAIAGVCVGSLVLLVASLWAHRRLAGPAGRPGCASMGAFVLAWLFGLATLVTGLFLLLLVFSPPAG